LIAERMGHSDDWLLACKSVSRGLLMANIPSTEYVDSREYLNASTGAQASGVSWGAVLGGAFVIAASSLILLALGAGFGLSVVSPWSDVGVSAPAIGALSIGWLILVEVIASALGGYLTGRLRIKWAVIHTDEVYFRDTANGFLAWAVALVVSATLLVSAAASMVGRVEQASARDEAVGSAAAAISPNAYFVDSLFRSDRTERADSSVRTEAGRILVNDLRKEQMPAADVAYLAKLVSVRSGLGQEEAEKRVSDVIASAREAEDSARKAAAHVLLWLFLALLTGAFSASYAATIGGRQRDHVKPA
jgi:hypothetical protein